VHQHHQVQRLLEPVTKFPQDGELQVHIPKGVKIVENIGAQPTVVTPSTRTEDLSARYNPITITIDFEVDSSRDGLHFVGCDDGDTRYPHVYTRNTISPGSACCVFPCHDTLTSRSTWEIAVTCPRSVRDALRGEHSVHTEKGATEDDDAQSQMSVVCSGDQISDVRLVLISIRQS
jgi:transcription initiation factor TFIID subunit 2